MKKLSHIIWITLLLLTLALPVAAQDANLALAWLRAYQQPNGGFTNGFAEGADFGTTAEIILAAVAAGEDVSAWQTEAGVSPLDYVAAQVRSGAVSDANALSRAIFVAVATGQNPRDFAGRDLVAALRAAQAPSGQFGDSLFAHAYAILALHNAGADVPSDAVTLLADAMTEDGAWSLFGDPTPGTADTNTTALAMQALVSQGQVDAARAALPYLRRMQNADGGFPYQKPSAWGTATDANSTAVVIQALATLDEPLNGWTSEGTDPLGALQALRDDASGAYVWQAAMPTPNVMATAQAIQAVAGMTFVAVPVVGAANPPQSTTASTAAPVLLPASGGTKAVAPGVIAIWAGVLLIGVGLRRMGRDE